MCRENQRYKLLWESANRLFQSPTPQHEVDDLCRRIMAELDCHAFFNYLVDDRTHRLHLNACAGVPADVARSIEWLDFGTAVCGCVVREGCRIVAENIPETRDPRTDLVRSFGITAYACHPLLAQGRVIGTLSFGTRSRTAFSDDDLAMMKEVADEVAMAMERIRTEEALRQSRDELEARVRVRTSDLARTVAELERRTAQLRALALDLTQAEQHERRRLARLLHDHLQQLLVGAKFNIGVLKGGAKTKKLQYVAQQVSDLLDDAIKESRSLCHAISPPVLYDSGLPKALEWLGRQMREKYGLIVEVEADEDAGPLSEAVRVLLFDAVRELLFNVVKHAMVDRASITLARDGARRVRLEVGDAGVGFDPKELEGGGPGDSGFGLFSIRERLQMLGGGIEVASAAGRGCRVTLMAPVDETPAVSETAVIDGEESPAAAQYATSLLDPAMAGGGAKIRVLLADDHKVMRQGLARLLGEQPDIEVIGQASDGRQAVELAAQTHPDVIVIDVTMPRMNGVEATRVLTRRMPDTRVIGLSMHEEADMAAAMCEAGAVAYLNKADRPEALLLAVRGCLRKPVAQQGPRPVAVPSAVPPAAAVQ